jgi:hypothetical protein
VLQECVVSLQAEEDSDQLGWEGVCGIEQNPTAFCTMSAKSCKQRAVQAQPLSPPTQLTRPRGHVADGSVSKLCGCGGRQVSESGGTTQRAIHPT